MSLTAKTPAPTTVLSATLVEAPATVVHELKKHFRDEFGRHEGAVERVELHRNRKTVAMAHNRGDGGYCSIETSSRGDEQMFKREWIAEFTRAGLQYRLGMSAFGQEHYDEDAVAQALLFEADGAQVKLPRSAH